VSTSEEWQVRHFSDVVHIQRGFDLPHHARRPGPYPVLTAGETGGFHDEGPVKGPGVTIGRATNLGQPKWSEGDFWPHNTTMFVKDFKGNHPRWVFHLFENTDLAGYDSGSVQPMLNRNYIAKVPVLVPPRRDQQAIAEVLGALDDKIAANFRLAVTADELTRNWFAALIATATSQTTVGALADHPRVLVEPDEVDPMTSYVGLEHVPRRHMWLDDSGVAEAVTSTKAAFREGDVLFGKLRPYFHKVVSAPAAGICSTDIMVVRSRESSLEGFVLAAVSSDKTVERCTAASEGTRMPRTSWKDLAAVKVPWPGDASARELSAGVVALRGRIDSGYRQNANLAVLRDALLPQLMSGKIRVKDAERVVEGVV